MVSADSGSATHEVTTPDLKLPWSDISAKVGCYVDGDRLSAGASGYVSDGGWTFGSQYQIGLYSEANIITVSYKPDDEFLPTVSVSMDSEIHHLAKIAAAATVVLAAYMPGALATLAPTAEGFLQKLSDMTPQFS